MPDTLRPVFGQQAHETAVDGVALDALQVGVEEISNGRRKEIFQISSEQFLRAVP
jgi:hypothetical protein